MPVGPSTISHGRRDSNPHPPVLETGALPVELRPFAAVVVPLAGTAKGPLREAASPGVLVTLVDFCLRWSGPVRTGALSAPTSAAPAGREATGPWSQRTRSLRPSTASGQHPARKPHCGSRRRGFVACPLRWSFRYVLQWPVQVDRPSTRVGATLPPGLTNSSQVGSRDPGTPEDVIRTVQPIAPPV